MKRWLWLLLVAWVAMMVIASHSAAAARHDRLPLHVGSAGPRCGALKWIDSGHAPNVFTKVKPLYRWDPHSTTKYYCGAEVMKATVAWKYRLGWPAPEWRQPVAGTEFFDLVTGKKPWPVKYVERAAKRVKAAAEERVTSKALRVKRLEESQIGQAPESWGINWGPRVSRYLAAAGIFHGGRSSPWCGAFQVWSFKNAVGLYLSGFAGVGYAAWWAAQRGYLHAKPKVGSIVVWIPRHMGFVSGVSKDGISTIEGNATNNVRRRFYSWSRLPGMKFIWLPGVA